MALAVPFVASAQLSREAVVGAETAFAAQTAQEGSKAAILAQSAPTAIVSEKGVWVNAQDLWKPRPAQTGAQLAWYPVLADASQSGDLGYTTGPWTSSVNDKPQAAGEYVTVWRKQPDGKLKFVIDTRIERIGTAPAKAAAVPHPRLMAAAATPSTAPPNIVIDIDKKFSLAQQMKPGPTYQQNLSAEARLYRPGLSMMQGAAAAANMKNLDGNYSFLANTGYLAASGDLGYVVGTVSRPAGLKHPQESGTYLRIWRREAVAGWRIVLEIFDFSPSAVAADAPSAPAPDNAPVSGQLPAKPSN